MLELFEDVTKPLTEYESITLLPVIVAGFRKYVGEENAIKEKLICKKLKYGGHTVTGARLRKIISHIRGQQLLEPYCLIGSSKGYYLSKDPEVIKKQIKSINGRIGALEYINKGLQGTLIKLIQGKPNELFD